MGGECEAVVGGGSHGGGGDYGWHPDLLRRMTLLL